MPPTRAAPTAVPESKPSRWTPFIAGIGIGLLSWAAFAIVNQPIGISTAVSEVSGAVAMPVVGKDVVLSNAYWAKTVPKWDYGTLFLAGTFLGALAMALLGRTFRVEAVPQVWRERFGGAAWKRFLAAFVGGAIVMFGARLAGGCTSGHGISGSLQLALSSWTFFLTMFATGLLTAWLMFGLSRPGGAGAA